MGQLSLHTALLTLFLVGVAVPRPGSIHAHPGRTAADGCHYCRTNCDSWGVPWNERHCHGGSAPAARTTPAPSTAKPAAPAGSIGRTTEASVAFPVVSVVDGDTIKIEDTDGSVQTVRLIGIDTPETIHPNQPVECFGKEASARLRQLLSGQKVYLATDAIGDTQDKYQRLLRYVLLGEARTDVNAQLIREGYAYAYTTYPFEKRDAYVQYQKRAEVAKVGLWAPGVCGSPAASEATNSSAVAQATATGTPEQGSTSIRTIPAPAEGAPVQLAQVTGASTTDDGFASGLVAGLLLALLGAGGWKVLRRRNPAE